MTNIDTALLRASALAAALVFAFSLATPGFGVAYAQDADTDIVTELDDFIADEEPPAFAEPDQAVEAFRQALADDDVAAIANLLGLDFDKFTADEASMEAIPKIRDGAAERLVLDGSGDSRTLLIGKILWPLPFPLVKYDEGWAFSTFDGIEEIVDRRIGENELQTIATLDAYLLAQDEYSDGDWDADGVLEYAQRLVSTPDETDGLYWPADQGDGESPAGAAVVQAQLDKAAEGDGYFGYAYRILTKQGDNVAGGALDYVVNGNMIIGHAVIAWPVHYDRTGVHTFMVSYQGVIYEADLGEDTAAIVEKIDSFNPGDEWDVVED